MSGGRASMARELNIVTPLHTSTKRDCLARMNDNKVEAMIKAKEYGFDYWDGERRYGYGGYRYIPGRWSNVAKAFIDMYNIKPGQKILDIGCGKGFLLYEIQLIEPGVELFGVDISEYGLNSTPNNLKAKLYNLRCDRVLPWEDNYFDLAFSLGTFHNLNLPSLSVALPEINRIAKEKYLMIESFRNEAEQFNLQCWALTAETLIDTESWKWLFRQMGYLGDYEFIYF